ncbi:MAG: phosphopantetheine-binding protein, partial [Nitrospiraceae bacterium]
LDSMATIELLYKIEEVFDLTIPDEDLPGLVTVGHVVTYVTMKVNSTSAQPGGKPAANPKPKQS